MKKGNVFLSLNNVRQWIGGVVGKIRGEVDPVPGAVLHYGLGGQDPSLTRFGGVDLRSAKAGIMGVGSWYDGSTQWDRGDIDDSDKIKGIEGAFTMAIWFNSFDTPIDNRLIDYDDSGAGGNGFIVFMDSAGRIDFKSNNIDTVTPLSYDDGLWHYLAVTYDGTTLKQYIDNVEVNSEVRTMNVFSSDELAIGGTYAGGDKWVGGLDDAIFYDKVLLLSELTTRFNYQVDYSPSQVINLLWTNPQDQKTITETLNEVSQINDKSGNNQHLVQSIGAKKMSTGLQKINGLNSLSSLTPDRFMENLTFPIPASGNISVSFVTKIDGLALSNAVSSSVMSMNATNDWQMDSANAAQFNGELDALSLGGRDPLTGGPFTGPDVWGIIFDFDNNIKKTFINGVERSSGVYTTKLDLSQQLRIFTNRTFVVGVFGIFGELIISEDVTDGQRIINEGYLSWTAGLVANLPIDHKHKEAPPFEISPSDYGDDYGNDY